jgi:hypothetical protein
MASQFSECGAGAAQALASCRGPIEVRRRGPAQSLQEKWLWKPLAAAPCGERLPLALLQASEEVIENYSSHVRST